MVTDPKIPSNLDFIDRREGTSPFVENSHTLLTEMLYKATKFSVSFLLIQW